MIKSYGQFDETSAIARLQELATNLRGQNPTLTFVVDDEHGVVYWQCSDGVDYGIYSLVYDGQIVKVWDNQSTIIHRHREVSNA